MKHLPYLYILVTIFTLSSCARTNNVTDIIPPYRLGEENAITDISSAEKVLIGSYAQIRNFSLIVDQPGLTGCMGLSFLPGPGGGDLYQQFFDNSVASNHTLVGAIYTRWYYLINMSNHVIQKTGRLSTTDLRKEQIIGEASFLRALSHFYLLRWFGRFYDANSEYGIVTWNQPVTDISTKPRSTVQESYDFILADLDYAIAHAPEYSTAVYASRQAAMMLKAKVLLYKRAYAQAATAASEAIQKKGAVVIEPVFDDVFKKAFNSKEVLLAIPFGAGGGESNNKSYAMRNWVIPNPNYFNFMAGDNRRASTLFLSGTTYRCGKFQTPAGYTGTLSTEYYLRFAELYLIQAEALIRSSSGTDNFQAARDAINVIRGRANMPLIANTVNTKADLLGALRKEKQLELGCESGEEWFDLVRFGVEGDLKVSDFKPNVKSETQYIIPIPNASIRAGQNVVKQNPGY